MTTNDQEPSTAMACAIALARLAAATRLPVLVVGENGAGKSTLARMLHSLGPDRERPCVSVHMPALSEALLATSCRRAAGGTLILDEVADTPPQHQAALVRMLETRSLRGESVAARIVGTTSADLGERVSAGRFRDDLRQRLAVVHLRAPPLRERLDELPVLVPALLAEARASWGLPRDAAATEDALAALAEHGWPGNLRELGNVVARLALGALDGTIDGARVRRELGLAPPASGAEAPAAPMTTIEEAVDKAFRSALAATSSDIEESARILGVSRATVYRWLKRAEPRSAPGAAR